MARIIAADDDLGLQRIYAHMLDYLGHDFVICCNGQEALDAFIQEPADLLLLDITMPVMSGLEVCRKIRMLPSGIHVPVIIVSANDSEEDIAAGFNAGADDYLLKPVRETALVGKLRNFLKISSLNRKELDLIREKVNFLDRYKINKAIGYGAHSVVFLATDSHTGNPVAVKLLNENVSDDTTLRRFIELVSQFKELNSEHLVRIYDYGQSNGQIYMILEYAAEGNLKKRMTTSTLDEKEASWLALNILDALEELERHDLVHLDVKPENIVIHDDKYKLADFGMVYCRDTATMPLKTEIWGTAAYVCPESLEESAELTVQSDIYSLGVTLFEAVTGDNPFLSGKPLVSMFRQVNFVPMPVSMLVEGFSCEFAELLSSMMSKNPAERSTIEELRRGFEFIYDSQFKGISFRRLTYPDPEERKRMLQSHEVVTKQVATRLDEFFHKRRNARSAGGRFFNRIGECLYVLLRYDNNRAPGFAKYLKPVLIFIIALALFSGAGYYAVSLFHYKPEVVKKLPLVQTMCYKCAFEELREVENMNTAKCTKCSGALGFAMKCGKCGNRFPWVKPDFPEGTPRRERNRKTAESLVCPACGAAGAEYISPVKKE
jgi:serine/threonine protein kinase